MDKSCFLCRNQNICKYKSQIFDVLEGVYSFTEDLHGLMHSVGKAIAQRCKYYIPFTKKELDERE